MRAKMVERWRSLLERLGAKGNPDQHYHQLAYYYMRPRRHYHNLGHIADCLDEFEGAKNLAPHPDEVRLAIWFHDAIYETWAKDNEYQSGQLANFFITHLMGLPLVLGAKVLHLVIATKHNISPEKLGWDARILVDVDLSSLGASSEQFAVNCKNLRNEHHWVELESYCRETINTLEGFLKRDSIYCTPYFRNKYEVRARLNLETEIKRLRTAL